MAVLDEARTLREHGIALPILVAEGFFDAEELEAAARLSLEAVSYTHLTLPTSDLV